MKGFRPKFVFLIIAIAAFCYLAFFSLSSKQTYMDDLVSSMFSGQFTTYKSIFSDLVTSREGTYGEIFSAMFTNNAIFLVISIVIYLALIILGCAGIWIPFNGLIAFVISVLNFDGYWLTANLAFGFHIVIISAIPVLCTIIYSVLNGPEIRMRRNAKLKAKQESSTEVLE